MTLLGAEHGFLEVEPHIPTERRADRDVVLLLHGLGGTKDEWRFPQWRDKHWDHTRPPANRDAGSHFGPPVAPWDVVPELGLSDLGTDVRCWSGILKALGHTVISYSQDGNQSTVDVPLRQFEDRIVPFLRDEVLTGDLAGKRVVVLCHSRGGILVRAYLHRHPDEGSQWISRVLTLCSPHAGTLAPGAKERLADDVTLLGQAVGGPFGLHVLLGRVVAEILGWLDDTPGARQLRPEDPIFNELAVPGDVPDIEFRTFGGTSVTYARIYAWHYTPSSYVPNLLDFPDVRFDWTLFPIEIGPVSPMLDALPDALLEAEQDQDRGDGLVADDRARLPGARHESVPVNHAEALWDEDLFARVADLLGTPIADAGPVLCGELTGELVLVPPVVSFGSVPVGETETRAVRIENRTGDTVRIQLAASPPGVFQWDAVDTELPSFEHSTISVGFHAADNTIRRETVRFTSTAPGSPHSFALVGKGGVGGFPEEEEPPLPTRLQYSARTISFGSVAVGKSEGRGLRIGNGTGRTVRVTIAASPSGSPFSWSAVDTSIAHGTDLQIGMTFAPQVRGTFGATLVVESDTAISPESITLAGKGGVGGF
jgi:pimeloyl-ACP methyl ester carboxylesterase